MRDKDTLHKIETVALLQQYLYMSDEHSITVENAIAVPLKIFIDDTCHVMCQNMSFKTVPPMSYDQEMTLTMWMDVADKLREMPAEEFPDRFKSRLEEIVVLTRTNLVLNQQKTKVPGYSDE